jgi:hypothetical protein
MRLGQKDGEGLLVIAFGDVEKAGRVDIAAFLVGRNNMAGRAPALGQGFAVGGVCGMGRGCRQRAKNCNQSESFHVAKMTGLSELSLSGVKLVTSLS